MYGSKFLDLWRDVDHVKLKQAWAEELAGYTAAEVKRGLDLCKTKSPTFPPTMPDFLVMCRTVLTAEAAFYEAVAQIQKREEGKDVWTHKAIYWAASRIGAHDLKNNSWQQLKGRWTAIFDEVLSAGIWPEIPAPREALPAPGQASISKEEAEKRAKEILSRTGFVPKEEIGGKDWAKKIIARVDAGEDVGFVAERFAREVRA